MSQRSQRRNRGSEILKNHPHITSLSRVACQADRPGVAKKSTDYPLDVWGQECVLLIYDKFINRFLFLMINSINFRRYAFSSILGLALGSAAAFFINFEKRESSPHMAENSSRDSSRNQHSRRSQASAALNFAFADNQCATILNARPFTVPIKSGNPMESFSSP